MKLELSKIELPLGQFTLAVDLVFTGRVSGVFGASGAGKTSLLEIVAGLRRPAHGAVRLDGQVLTDVAAHTYLPPERRAIGYVPQEGALFPHLSVRQNLLYGDSSRRVAAGGSPVAGLEFEHVVSVLEIAALADRRIQTLSGGEKQRVALGRALLGAPRLLLLDEPLGGLDTPLRERVLPYLARVRTEFEIPMIYVSHAAEEMIALCDEVIVLAAGKIEARGTPAALFEPSPAAHYVRRSQPL